MRVYFLERPKHGPVLREQPSPVPGPGQLLIQNEAVSIHPVDLSTRVGSPKMMLPAPYPFVPGVDFTGTVLQVGAGASDFEPGMKIYGYRGVARMGAFAEELLVSENEIARAPEGMDAVQRAALPLSSICALEAYTGGQSIQARTALVHGGAGGVGSIAVQIFAAKGFHVIATASGKDATWVQELGAAEVIDYRETSFETVVKDVDLVFDTVGGDTLKRSFGVVREGGQVRSISTMPSVSALQGAGVDIPWFLKVALPLMSFPLRQRARKAKVHFEGQAAIPSRDLLEEATRIAEESGLKNRIARVFPFSELPEAMDFAASGEARGRVVVTV